MIDGIKLNLNGEEYIVPPLTFKQIKKLYPLIEELNGNGGTVKKMETIVTLTHAALSRNYPELTIEKVEDLVDLGNLKTLSEAVLGASGFTRGER